MRTSKRPARLAAEELFDYAVKILAARACSTEEMRNKLRNRAARAADIQPTIDRLTEIGYLNDNRFAESYANARVENDGFGKMRVLSDLRGRRVAANLADKAVAQAFEGREEAELLAAYIDRRMPTLTGQIDDDRKLAAAYRRLRRAGFSSGAILTELKRRAKYPERIDEAPPEETEDESL